MNNPEDNEFLGNYANVNMYSKGYGFTVGNTYDSNHSSGFSSPSYSSDSSSYSSSSYSNSFTSFSNNN